MTNEDKIRLANKIFKSLFKPSKGGQSLYDVKKDYRLIWDSFKAHRGVDLNKDKINWWEFSSMMEGLLLENNSSIAKVIEIRQTKIPKVTKENRAYVENLRKLKTMYALDYGKSPNAVLGDLFNFVKQRAGEKNGS